MARFILDIATDYKKDRDKTKKAKTESDIKTNFKNFMERVGDIAEEMGGFASITCIEPHNTAQFHGRTYLNKLTKKQIRKFNEQPHG
jgi:hypothetical protein